MHASKPGTTLLTAKTNPFKHEQEVQQLSKNTNPKVVKNWQKLQLENRKHLIRNANRPENIAEQK